MQSILRQYGIHADLEEIARLAGQEAGETSLLGLRRAADHYGVQSSAEMWTVQGLFEHGKALCGRTILHMNRGHFVLLTDVVNGAVIVTEPFEPKCAKTRFSREELAAAWSGKLLVLAGRDLHGGRHGLSSGPSESKERNMDISTEMNPAPRVQSFHPELNCVELQYAVKIAAGESRPHNKHFIRADVLPAEKDGISVPLGPKYAQALMQPQILQCLLSFRAADPGVIPPWTGEIGFRFDSSNRRLTVIGDLKSAYPEPEEIQRLSSYCHALANMLVAYAQLPGTPDFGVTFKSRGFWDEPR